MRIKAMANRKEMAIIPADQVDDDSDENEVLEGEVLGADEGKQDEDFTSEVKAASDDLEALDETTHAMKANSFEGRRLAMVGGMRSILCLMKHGEVAIPHVERFIDALGDGARRNAWRIWFEKLGPVVWDRNREVDNGKGKMVKKAGFVLSTPRRNELNDQKRKDGTAKFATNLLQTTPWKLTPEAQYKGMDIHKSIRGILAQAKRQVDPEYLKRTKASEDDLKLNDFEGLNELQMLDRMLSERKAKAAAAQQNGSQAVH
jgi:hypothetical protein